MKVFKKVATVILALLLVLSTMSIAVNAVGETGNVWITMSADKTDNLYPGDIVTFTINIKNDFNYTCMRWPVMYTLKAFEPVIANDGTGDRDYGNVQGFMGSNSGYESILESAELPSSSTAFGGTYTKANYGGILLQWTAGTTGSGMAYYHEANGSACITFQLRVKSGYTSNRGVATVIIPTTTQAKTLFYYQGIADPTDPTTLYEMSNTSCTVTSTGATVNIISEAAAIVGKAGTDTVLDDENGYIYGLTGIFTNLVEFGPDTAEQFITLKGKATYTLEPNEWGVYSTGAVLHGFDADGNSIGDYTVVVFGDVDGNGSVDVADISAFNSALVYNEEWAWGDPIDNAKYLACDTNADGIVFGDDFGPFQLAIAGQGYINQTYDSTVSPVSGY